MKPRCTSPSSKQSARGHSACSTYVLAVVLAVAAALPARAEVVVLSQPGVPQYAEVSAGFREARGAPIVDVADDAAVGAALARHPDVVVAVGSRALEVARAHAGRAAVVAAAVLALGAGDVGVAMEARAQDAVKALRAVAPRVRNVAVLHAPGASGAVLDAKAAARAAGLDVELESIDDLSRFQERFQRAVEGHDAVWLLPDPRIARPDVVRFMVTTCLTRRVALVGFLDGMTRTGALLSVGADFRQIGRDAARLAAELERLPPAQRAGVGLRFAPGKLTVNARARDLLGVDGAIPANAEVIR